MIIRQANSSDAPSIARVNVESWHSTYKGIVPKRYLEAMSAEQYAKKWGRIIEYPASIVLVAEIDSQVIGYISGGMERSGKLPYEGELYAIYLLKEHQRKGIGKKLVKKWLGEMRKEKFQNMMVWVIDENPSKRFYEAMGGKTFIQEKLLISGKELKELGYGWSSLDDVLI